MMEADRTLSLRLGGKVHVHWNLDITNPQYNEPSIERTLDITNPRYNEPSI